MRAGAGAGPAMMLAPPARAVAMLGRLLEQETGQQLSESRRWRIETSLRPLMRECGLASLDALAEAIACDASGALRAAAVDAMLNHESFFFRDLAVFRMLEQHVLPRLHAGGGDRTLRIWSAGCAGGQEAYSIAMILKRMGALWEGWRIAIVATDVSPLAIERARAGLFSQMDMQRGLPINELLRWFEPEGKDWRVSAELRRMIDFQADHLLAPRAVSGAFDLILCRNVLLYFSEAQRAQVARELARRARAGAFLVLGAGETLVGQQAGFASCRDMSCIYTARPAG